MDFLKTYDARSAAETPITLELRDPATGDVIMNGDGPCMVMIKGAASRSVQEGLKQEALERARLAKSAKGKDGQADTQIVADLHENACRSAARLITGFRNMQTTGPNGLRDLTPDDAAGFLDLNFFSIAHALKQADDDGWRHPSFAQQILDAAGDDARFLAKRTSA